MEKRLTHPNFPGTTRHQALLQVVVDRYQSDPRVLAVIVFGSLGCGSWDEYSDLDLDVILRDQASLDVPAELQQLGQAFAALGDPAVLVVPDGDDCGDLVLESLAQLSIRYHPLADTSPDIVESMQVLAGCLEPETIAAAGRLNRRQQGEPLGTLLERCLRFTVVANVGLQRGHFWYSEDVLHRLRGLLMEIYARTHGGQRSVQTFDRAAGKYLQTRLGAVLPQNDALSTQAALRAALDVLELDLPEFSNGQLALTLEQRGVLERLRRAIASPD